jgi:hypothetical protein
MLVDSYQLEFRLFEDGFQQMFNDPDITVIAVLPGPMRKSRVSVWPITDSVISSM